MSGGFDPVQWASMAVAIMTPLLFASLGGLFTALSGTLNIALEGLIAIGAFFGIIAAEATQSLIAGLCAGVAASTIAALGFGLVTLRLRANEFVTGLATNLFASGLTVVLSQQLFKSKAVLPFDIPALAPLRIPFVADIPLLGAIFSGHDALVYSGWLMIPLTWLVLEKTVFGMRLRATGSNPKAILALGLKPDRYKLAAILVSGAACGIAGCFLSFSLSAYVPDISSGRGWIALVAIYLGRRRPSGITLACATFALAESFSNIAQGFLRVPADFILTIPYLATLLALVAGAAISKARGNQ